MIQIKLLWITTINIFEVIYGRRAVKHFDRTHRLSGGEELKLLEATIQAPTAFNIQHWRFVILRNPGLRARIRAELGNGQSQINNAALLVLFTADVKAWKKILNDIARARQGKSRKCSLM